MVGVPAAFRTVLPSLAGRKSRQRLAALAVLWALGLAACASPDPMAAGLAAAKKGDYKAAFEEWLPLARDGDTGAQYNIAQLYRLGRGVDQNYTEAARWYAAAAEFFHSPSRYNLAVMYEKGLGVPINYEEARRFYKLAANQGYRQAQFNLGVMYSIGQGTRPDWPQAHMWYSLAADQGDDRAARNLTVLAGRMSPEELARAAAMRDAWERRWR